MDPVRGKLILVQLRCHRSLVSDGTINYGLDAAGSFDLTVARATISSQEVPARPNQPWTGVVRNFRNLQDAWFPASCRRPPGLRRDRLGRAAASFQLACPQRAAQAPAPRAPYRMSRRLISHKAPSRPF